jgi:hypothetical protein
MGLLNATVNINDFADVITEGLLAGLDTSSAVAGNPVWLGTGGNLIYGLANKPYAPSHLVFIGIVTRVNANNGEIFVKVQNGFELDEIHDIDLKTTAPINGHLLGYNGTLWVNKTIAGWLGYTPQAQLNGTGFVKASGTTITYDNTSYYPASNPNGYISTYTETDTLATVTGRGASTSTAVTLSSSGNTFNGHHYFSAYDANGNHYPHYNNGGNNNGSKLNLRMFDTSGNAVVFYLNGADKSIQWNGNNIWHAGNLTNLNQLTNGPGYITGYTETDTLATVTSRGATTASNISVNGVRLGRDFSIANRGTVRIDANGTSAPADILFGHTSAANQSSWDGVYWAISSRAAENNNRFTIWRGGGNPSGSTEARLFTIEPTGDINIGIDSSISQAIRLGGDNAAGGRLYIQYAGDSSYIDAYGGHGSTQRYRDLQIVGRNLNLTSSGGNVNANGSQVVTNNGGTWGINITGNATSLNSSNYIDRTSGSNLNTDFQNTPAGTKRYMGDHASLTNSPGGTWWIYENMRHSNASNYWGTQVAWGWEDNQSRLATRNVSGGTFGSWVYYLNSSNYNSYSPTLTGGNASGTWGINITGNAGGNSATVTGLTIANSGNPTAIDSTTQNYIGYTNSLTLFGQSDGGLYDAAYSSAWQHQIYGDFRTGQIAIRGKNSGTWQSWRTVIDSSNVSSYAWPTEGSWKPGSLSSSTRLRGATSPDGGEFGLAYSGGQIHPYTDGFFYQNEGAYRVIDTNSINSYAPTPTGGNASGTWNIGITGTASTANNVNISNLNSQQVNVSLAGGNWYTIAANAGDRASAKFTITDPTSGLHQAIHFYASAHFGTLTGAKISVLSNTYYSGPPITAIRTLIGSTYDGAMVQIYANSSCTVTVSISDNQQVGGWVIRSGVISSTNPGIVSNFGALSNTAAYVETGSGKSFSISDDIYIGGRTTQYVALHAGNYNSYAPTKTGGGASGTWDIGISGNANTAGTAQTANQLGGIGYERYIWGDGANGRSKSKSDGNANVSDSSNSSGFYFGTNVAGMPGSDWWNWITCAGDSWSGGDGYRWQLANSFWSDDLRIRRMTSGTWAGWNRIYTDAYRPYADSAGSAARATRANGNFYIDDNYGNTVVGVYNASRFQGVFAMGDAYKLAANGTSCADHYGIAWSHPNAGGQAANLSSHGMLVQQYGVTMAAISTNIWCSGDVIAYSDARVKDNVEVIDNPLERIKKVRGVTFTRTDLDDKDTRHAGVIAQEMREALPEVVSENSEGNLSVSYGNSIALLIECIKEQQTQIEELKDLVTKLINK